MAHFREFLRRRGANLFGERIRRCELRKGGLDRFIAPPQRVVIGIRDRWRILRVIAPVMRADFFPKAGMFAARLCFAEALDRGWLLHPANISMSVNSLNSFVGSPRQVHQRRERATKEGFRWR